MDEDLKKLLLAWLSPDVNEAESRLIERLQQDAAFRRQFIDEIVLLGQLKAVQASEPRWLEVEDIIGSSLVSDLSADQLEQRVMESLSQPASLFEPTQSSPTQSSPTPSSTTQAFPCNLTDSPPRVAHWPYVVFVFVLAAMFGTLAWLPNYLARRQAFQSSESTNPSAAYPNEPQVPVAIRSAPKLVAVLSQAIEPQWIGDRQPQVGESLPVGDLRLASGTVQLEFFSGVHLLLRGPADIELRDTDEVQLRQGEASCFVTEVGRGFRILTKEMEVIDLGTAFSISVHEGQRPEVHVLEGAVEIKSDNAPTIEVKRSHAVRMGEAGPVDVEFNPDRFPQPAELQAQRRHVDRLRFDSWKQWSADRRQDKDTLLHYTFQEQPSEPFELTNTAGDASRASSGVVIGCSWTEGRWPTKRGLLFRNQGDRVLLHVPGQYERLTFMTWVRIDSLTQKQTSILMTEEAHRRKNLNPSAPLSVEEVNARRQASQVKSVRWEIFQPDPRVTFSVAYDNGSAGWLYESCRSKVGYPDRSDLARWICLVVTCDTEKGEVVEYLNGQEIGRLTLEHRHPLLLDYMTLGNFSISPAELERSQGLAQRRFYGAIDELLIAQRIYTAEEISTAYAQGQP